MSSLSSKTKKALIIGIDGVPHSLLDTYIEGDVMPNLKRILNEGYKLHKMNASIPDVSSVSWTSFATGVNPGEHGIYGFTGLQADYSLSFPNSRDIKVPRFWEILGKTNLQTSTFSEKYLKKVGHPRRSIIFNLPHSYPASPMNGILVSGFVAIDLKKATFPETAYTYLRSINYLIDVDAEKAKEDKRQFLDELSECLEIRKRAISHFFNDEPWDLFVACITETDRLHHFFFDASNDRGSPYYELFLDFYAELDKFINLLYNRFMETYSEKGFFMILSDHGFAPIKEEVYINPFLQKMGFLELQKEGHYYERIGNKTKAFNLDPCRIYVNYRDVYHRGTVRREERLELLREIRVALQSLKGEKGEDVIDKIFQAEEIYKGPCLDRAPDLVCLPEDGYDLKGGIEKKEIFGQSIFTGMHTWNDAFCILPAKVRLLEKPSIEYVTDYLLQYFTQ
jgi:predicted AlkP superfamily phosphohydrolase/phosphomutase